MVLSPIRYFLVTLTLEKNLLSKLWGDIMTAIKSEYSENLICPFF